MHSDNYALEDLNKAINARQVALVATILAQQPELACQKDADDEAPICNLLHRDRQSPDDSASVIAITDHLLKAGMQLEHGVNTSGDTVLHLAAYYRYSALVLHLVRKGANINAANRYDCTPLTKAVIKGNKPLVITLVRLGARCCAADIHEAICSRQLAIVQALAALGADIYARDKDGRDWLLLAVTRGDHALVEYFLQRGFDPNRLQGRGMLPLGWVAQLDDQEKLQSLLRHGALINGVDSDGKTALHYAAEAGTAKTMQLLIDAGADVNAKSSCGNTPLHYAVEHPSERTIHSLIQHGADINMTNRDGLTPLASATLKGKKEIATVLAKLHSMAELEQQLATRGDERYSRKSKNVFKSLDAVYAQKVNACTALKLVATDRPRVYQLLTTARVGFFAACRHPVSNTGLPFDVQMIIARHHLELSHSACERLLNALSV